MEEGAGRLYVSSLLEDLGKNAMQLQSDSSDVQAKLVWQTEAPSYYIPVWSPLTNTQLVLVPSRRLTHKISSCMDPHMQESIHNMLIASPLRTLLMWSLPFTTAACM